MIARTPSGAPCFPRGGPRWLFAVTWTEHARTLTLRTGSLEEAEEQASRAIERGSGDVVIMWRGTVA